MKRESHDFRIPAAVLVLSALLGSCSPSGHIHARIDLPFAVGTESRTTVRLPRQGSYAAVLTLARNDVRYWPRANDSLPFRLRIQIDTGGGSVVRTIDRGASYYGAEGEGIWVTTFEAPSEVPVQRAMPMTIVVLAATPEFVQAHGPFVFSVQRLSDH